LLELTAGVLPTGWGLAHGGAVPLARPDWGLRRPSHYCWCTPAPSRASRRRARHPVAALPVRCYRASQSRFRRWFLPLRVRPRCAGVWPELAAGELHGPTAVGVRGAGTFFGRLLSLGDVVCADAGLVLRLYSGLPGAGLGDGRARV